MVTAIQKRAKSPIQVFPSRAAEVSQSVSQDHIQGLFARYLDDFTGGVIPLQMEQGAWRDRMSGKEILHAVINQCFRVPDRQGTPLQGKLKLNEAVKDLLRLPPSVQPSDFQQLRRMISARMAAS